MSKSSLFSSLLNVIASSLYLFVAGCGIMEEKKQMPITPVVVQLESTIPKSMMHRKHKVALLVPLSGLHADTGYSLQRAAEMGLFEHPNNNLELVVKDTYGTVEGARQATDEALTDNVELIIGPLLSNEVSAVAARTHGRVPILAFSNDRTVAAKSVFVMGFAPADQIKRLCGFAVNQGFNELTVVVPQNDYGTLVTSVFENLQRQKLIKVVSYVTYNPDLPHEMSMTAEVGGQGIFFAEGGYTLMQVMDVMQEQGLNFNQYKLLGMSQWDDPQTLLNARLAGAYYVNSDKNNQIGFDQNYETNYKAKPFKVTSYAYDAISLVSALITIDGNLPFVLKNMTQNKGFAGVNGLFRLKNNGHVERGLAIFEITGQESQIVDPAPQHF